MRRFVTLIVVACCSYTMVWANPLMGVDSVASSFFREWYQSGELVHYLDNMTDYVTYEAETTGEWYLPEQKVFLFVEIVISGTKTITRIFELTRVFKKVAHCFKRICMNNRSIWIMSEDVCICSQIPIEEIWQW